MKLTSILFIILVFLVSCSNEQPNNNSNSGANTVNNEENGSTPTVSPLSESVLGLLGQHCTEDACVDNVSLYCNAGAYEVWKLCQNGDVCAYFSVLDYEETYTDCFKSCSESEIGLVSSQCDEDRTSHYQVETRCSQDIHGTFAYIYSDKWDSCEINCKDGLCQPLVPEEGKPCGDMSARCDGEIAVECQSVYSFSEQKYEDRVVAVDCSLYYGSICFAPKDGSYAKCIPHDTEKCTQPNAIKYICDDQYFADYGDYDLIELKCVASKKNNTSYWLEDSMNAACGATCDAEIGECK